MGFLAAKVRAVEWVRVFKGHFCLKLAKALGFWPKWVKKWHFWRFLRLEIAKEALFAIFVVARDTKMPKWVDVAHFEVARATKKAKMCNVDPLLDFRGRQFWSKSAQNEPILAFSRSSLRDEHQENANVN